jgi:hypothetical protein
MVGDTGQDSRSDNWPRGRVTLLRHEDKVIQIFVHASPYAVVYASRRC